MKRREVVVAAAMSSIVAIFLITMNVSIVEGSLKKENTQSEKAAYEQAIYAFCEKLSIHEKQVYSWNKDIDSFILEDGKGTDSLEAYFKQEAEIWNFREIVFIGKRGSSIIYAKEAPDSETGEKLVPYAEAGKIKVIQDDSGGKGTVTIIMPMTKPIVLEQEYNMIAVVYEEEQIELFGGIDVLKSSTGRYIIDSSGNFVYEAGNELTPQERKVFVEESAKCNGKKYANQSNQEDRTIYIGDKAYHIIYQSMENYNMTMIEIVSEGGWGKEVYSILITAVIIVCAALAIVSVASFSVVLRQEFYTAGRKADEEKSRTLSVMSHEMRTPLNTILGISQLVEKNARDPDKMIEYAEKIELSGRMMLSLINNVLDMGQIENGSAVLNESTFSLSQMLNEIGAVMKYQAKEKEQLYTVRINQITHDLYIGDKIRLRQIIMNLLSNAIKYTANSGAIMLSVTEEPIRTEEDSGSKLSFEVKDNGCGMSKEYQKTIFEPYSRENKEFVNQAQGTGLGMAITKSFVDLMGGTLAVESEIGVGTTITVELVLKTANKEISKVQEREEECKDAFKDLHGLKVLIADDYSMNANMLAEILETEGIAADIADNGKEALELFLISEENEYDSILMDVRMPVMNGYEAARAIRGQNRGDAGAIPILAMTANTSAEEIRTAYEAGMDDYIPKPIDIDELKQKIKKHIKENRK